MSDYSNTFRDGERVKLPAHTPGPWRFDPENHRIISETAFEDYTDGDDERIPKSIVCLIGAMGGTDTKADARLIAAAPDLLAALRCLLDAAPLKYSGKRSVDAREQARAAIAKATTP